MKEANRLGRKNKKGNLVRVYGYPECGTEIDLECLGVLENFTGEVALVRWPNLGLLEFKSWLVESIE